ncbi:hypothetical protein [Helicobacter suis]|uniref:hypothetical protein n=1 Tax=Helicobacter suis TaxID=104628 RepID=UPI0013D62477|nr:hypothetical protein [Helicobacter suis]
MNWEKIGWSILENIVGGASKKAGEYLGERVFGGKANNTFNRVSKYSKHRKLGKLINQYGRELAKPAFEYERQQQIKRINRIENKLKKRRGVINAIRNNQQQARSGYFIRIGLNKRRRRRRK